MNRSVLPASAFIDPWGGNRKEIERLFREAVALLLPFLTEAAARSPLPVASIPEALIPETSVAADELLEKLRPLIADSMNLANPGFIGHMNSMPTTVSILGDLVASALSNNMLFYELSPVFTPLEVLLMKQFARLFGLGERAGGVLLGSGTMANLQILAVARNIRFGSMEKGIQSSRTSPVILASEAAHASVRKAAMILGLGTSSVIPVATDEHSRMRPESLRDEIVKARADGHDPFCVVATAGTTVTGNIDPLVEIGRIAREHDLWFHTDAAYGGALVFSEKYGHRLTGIEQADSVTFNPQKWLYVSNGCAMALFRNTGEMEQAFRVPSPYAGDDGGFTNLGEITVHGSRRVEVLKLWLSLQHIGRRGYRQLVDEGCRLAEHFLSKVEERPHFELVGKPDMNILCFRGTPEAVSPARWDEWNTRLQAYLLREKGFFLSCPPYRGAHWLRVVLLNPYADEQMVDRLFDDIDSFAVE
ncbi:MAG TPA: pyridoxal-dependent decarboxylase [Pyrinomonadaceae bacterium]|jgi:glutamate/tyrosine decarboxylase-like PLP-dependent enzyme|nr:pyridoxal-dependent decarboxylase [Pyrinomonadaceae bacterium]